MTEKHHKAAQSTGKDVIYIDADDEITSIIDKVRGSDQKIVALVLPKRATVLQSLVNMKLLKRSSDAAKKKLVLITVEAGLLPLAGSTGLYVAKSLQSKPEVPEAPSRGDDSAETIEEDGEEAEGMLDTSRPIGELAGISPSDEDTIELDSEDDSESSGKSDGKADGKPVKGKDKKLKIPNFNRFRLVLVLGGVGVVALGVALYFALAVMPKASITVKTDTSTLSSNVPITLTPGDSVQLVIDEGIVPAHKQEVKKVIDQQVPATGQQNNGVKATGSMKITNCSAGTLSLAAGTGFNASGHTFISDAAVNVPKSTYSFTPGGFVCNGDGTASVAVTAQKGGADYNLTSQTYNIANNPSNVTAKGGDMAGGTDDISKIVTQADIDSAAQKISAQDSSGIAQQLKTDLTNGGFMPINMTMSPGTTETKSSVNPGDKADTVTVTQTITYTMLGVKEADLKKIIENDMASKIDPKKQSILDYGLENADFLIQEQKPESTGVTLQTKVVAGPLLDTEAIKKQVAGKKSGDAQTIIKAYPGVTEVTVDYSPFWVSSIPSKTSKITVTVEKPQAASEADDTSNSP